MSAARGATASLAMVHPIQAASLFAALIFLLASRPRARELPVLVVSAAFFAWAHRIWFALFHFRGVPVPQSLLLAMGLGSLAALASRAAAAPRDDASWEWLHWAIILPSFGMIMDLCLDLTIAWHPRAWDPVLLRLDCPSSWPRSSRPRGARTPAGARC